ncbi:SixA phosphatase family protein [Rhodocaloribacter sp.]
MKALRLAAPVTLFVVLAGLCAPRLHAQPHETAVVYLVRHAEAVSPELRQDPKNPHLSEAGHMRAAHLAYVLGDAGITRILSTDFHRTRETARPLAEKLGLDVASYDPYDLPGFAEALRGMRGRILVAGHSNTTPKLVELLGGDPGPPIDEKTEYDRLYVVVLGADGAVTTTLLRYGAP